MSKVWFDVDVAKEVGVGGAVIVWYLEKDKKSHNGKCLTYANLKEFTEVFPFLTLRQVERIVKNLEKKRWIEREEINPEEIVEKLKSKSIEKPYICEWCGEKVAVVDEHHYPIPKSKGGIDVVRICPNCHYTFHRIMGRRWCKE